MREHSLNLSGTVDDKTAAQLGKLVGAAVLVFGNISTYKYDVKKSAGDPWTDKEGNDIKRSTLKVLPKSPRRSR